MIHTKLLSLTLTLVLLGGSFFSTEVHAAEPGSEQWKAEANLSLSEYGAESPYYSTGQQANVRPAVSPDYYSWFNPKEYSIYCDPVHSLRLLKNVGMTEQVEATPSTGVIPDIRSELSPGCLPDFSNRIKLCFPYETVGITASEFTSIPLPAPCASWRDPATYANDILNYSEKYHNLIWAHKGNYSMYQNSLFDSMSTQEFMQTPVLVAPDGLPIGHNVKRYKPGGTYDGKNYNGAVQKISVTYPYPTMTPFYTQRTMEISYGILGNEIEVGTGGTRDVFDVTGAYYDDVWTIHFVILPNEMDLQYIHGLLRMITPDADAIFAAIKTDLYGPKDRGPWNYPNERYTLGYAPWKYYDKWYDIGNQSRICSSYIAKTENGAAAHSYQGMGFTGSGYIYRIAPRVGIGAPGYELRYEGF